MNPSVWSSLCRSHIFSSPCKPGQILSKVQASVQKYFGGFATLWEYLRGSNRILQDCNKYEIQGSNSSHFYSTTRCIAKLWLSRLYECSCPAGRSLRTSPREQLGNGSIEWEYVLSVIIKVLKPAWQESLMLCHSAAAIWDPPTHLVGH